MVQMIREIFGVIILIVVVILAIWVKYTTNKLTEHEREIDRLYPNRRK
jgi:heme/copper-type cytochrome/quinol oxidase subunit 4